MNGCLARLSTPKGHGAIGLIDVVAEDGESLAECVDSFCRDVPSRGAFALRGFADVDSGIAARLEDRHLFVMSHGSPMVIERLLAHLRCPEAQTRSELSALDRYPEAMDEVEACILDAISRCSSPLGIDAVLLHGMRWRTASADERERASDYLRFLREPALVALYGPPNVGKSTLTNAMAGRGVSVVADEPGTTVDHVGVLIECDGVLVHWLDTPGLGVGVDDPGERSVVEHAAMEVIANADLLIECVDVSQGGFNTTMNERNVNRIRCATRCDLGMVEGADCSTSAVTGQGLEGLARLIRERLVGGDSKFSGPLWRFHPDLPS